MAFLHIAFGDAQIADDALQLLGHLADFGGVIHIRGRDNFQQRRPRPVQVDGRETAQFVVVLAGVFFEVGTDNAHPLDAAVFQRDFDKAVFAQRQVVLADLVFFAGRVLVAFAVQLVKRAILAIEGHRASITRFRSVLVHHRIATGITLPHGQVRCWVCAIGHSQPRTSWSLRTDECEFPVQR